MKQTTEPSQNARRLRQKLRALIADKNTMPIDKKVYKAKLDQLEKGQLTEKLISAELDRIEFDDANDPLKANNI